MSGAEQKAQTGRDVVWYTQSSIGKEQSIYLCVLLAYIVATQHGSGTGEKKAIKCAGRWH